MTAEPHTRFVFCVVVVEFFVNGNQAYLLQDFEVLPPRYVAISSNLGLKGAFIMYYRGGGKRNFWRDTKIFRTKLGELEIFNRFIGGMSNFPLILVNSVGLHYKLIYHLPEIFNTKDTN